MNAGDYLDLQMFPFFVQSLKLVTALGNQGILFRLLQLSLAIQFAKIEPWPSSISGKRECAGLLLAKVASEKPIQD
jgi:hypothetical protein